MTSHTSHPGVNSECLAPSLRAEVVEFCWEYGGNQNVDFIIHREFGRKWWSWVFSLVSERDQGIL